MTGPSPVLSNTIELLDQLYAGIQSGAPLDLDYTNHQGRRRFRQVQPLHIWYGATKYHPVPGFLLIGIDRERGVIRDFAAGGIHAILAAPAEKEKSA